MELIEKNLTPSRVMTREAFENAIAVHSAVGGSSNYLLHLPAIARAAGMEVRIEDFERIHRTELSRLPRVARIQSSFAMREVVNRAVPPVIFGGPRRRAKA